MHERIAVHLGGRGGQEQRALGLREAERPMGAEGADLQRLDRQLEVVPRRGGAGEVQHPVERPAHADVLRHVVAHETDPGPRREGGDAVRRPGDEIVHGEELAEVGADEARPACYQGAHRADDSTGACYA